MFDRQRPYYFSSIRGNASTAACSYENPCTASFIIINRDVFRRTYHHEIPQVGLAKKMKHSNFRSIFVASDVDIVLLSGEYSFKDINVVAGFGNRINSLTLRGQPDCWPAPKNATVCPGTEPIVSTITMVQSELSSLFISNIICSSIRRGAL
jgi:hypothetical protein